MHGSPQASFRLGSIVMLFDLERQRRAMDPNSIVRVNCSARPRAKPSPHVADPGGSPPSAKSDRVHAEARIDAAAAVESSARIRLIEIEHDARVLHALVLVERVLELRVDAEVGVEHQVLADDAARIGKAVLEAGRRGVEQQPRRLAAVRAEHDGLGALQLQLLLRRRSSETPGPGRPAQSRLARRSCRTGSRSGRSLPRVAAWSPSTSTSRGTRT